MTNSKISDISYMLTELCLAFNDDEQQKLIRLSAKMKINTAFRKSYLKILQQKYLQELSSILNGTYEKKPFGLLNKFILSTWISREFNNRMKKKTSNGSFGHKNRRLQIPIAEFMN